MRISSTLVSVALCFSFATAAVIPLVLDNDALVNVKGMSLGIFDALFWRGAHGTKDHVDRSVGAREVADTVHYRQHKNSGATAAYGSQVTAAYGSPPRHVAAHTNRDVGGTK